MSTYEARAQVALPADVASTPQITPPGQWTLFWRRFRRDKFALGSAIFILLLLLLLFVGYPLFESLLGHSANDQFPYSVGFGAKPSGPWTWIPDTHVTGSPHGKTLFLLGADGSLGRDEFLRMLRGGESSLEVGLGSALLALLVGVPLGALAGLLGGWTDATVARLTEFFMGFPILLLVVALGWSVRERLDGVTLHGVFGPGVLALTLLIGAFSCFYPARIVRASVLSLRRQEFVDAARMVGGGTWWIVRKHLLPHLVGPVAVYFAIIAATNIVLESALSFLNLGIPLPDPSWGNMLASNWGHFFIVDRPETLGIYTTLWTTALPAVAIAVTVLALSLFGEGVRRAFDPGAQVR